MSAGEIDFLARPPVKEARELVKEERPVPLDHALAPGGPNVVVRLPRMLIFAVGEWDLLEFSSSRISPTLCFSSRVRARPTYSEDWSALRTLRYELLPVS